MSDLSHVIAVFCTRVKYIANCDNFFQVFFFVVVVVVVVLFFVNEYLVLIRLKEFLSVLTLCFFKSVYR